MPEAEKNAGLDVATCESIVRYWAYRYSKNLPSGLASDDMEQEGRMVIFELSKQLADMPKNGAISFLHRAIQNRLNDVVNKARFGVTNPAEKEKNFSIVSYDAFSTDDGSFDYLEMVADASPAGFRVPDDPELKMKIWSECQSLLDSQGAQHRVNNLTNVGEVANGTWTFRFMINGIRFSQGGYGSKLEVAKAKWNILKRIQEAVTPFYVPKGEEEKPLKKNHGEHRFHRITKKRLAIIKDHALPYFMYLDPLDVMLILERLCLKNQHDHTEIA